MKNEIIRCKCVDMSVDGQGIARSGQLVVFVKGLIKGEEADVKIIAEKKNYSYGIIDRLISVSPYRIESDCPIAYKCGGCDYRHISYDYQLELKKEVLRNTFRDYEVADVITATRYRFLAVNIRWDSTASFPMISSNSTTAISSQGSQTT